MMDARNIKVLVLEDEAAHAEAIRRALKASPILFQVKLVGALKEYHESVAADPPDIALLDMILPDGGALELLGSPPEANPFPRVVMTSHGDEQTAVAAMKAGALDYIVKSSETFADMPHKLTNALDHWQLLQERKQAERYREMGREVLQILNEQGDLQGSIQRILAVLKTRTGFDAVGIRLQDGDDFPYFAQEGFSRDFLLAENTLIERAADGGVCRDKDGKVNLECTCGLVISGKTDPMNPYFTRGGSCWTNDKDGTPFQDTRLHPRDRCLHDGFQSVALAPIQSKDRIVGLIQLNDRRKGYLTLEIVEILEGIASHIGEALMRKQSEEALNRSEAQYRLLAEHMTDTVWLMDLNLKTMYQSPSAEKLRGYTPQEILELPLDKHATPESLKLAFEVLSEEIPRVEADPGYNPVRILELEYYRKDGTTVWAESKFSIIRDSSGKPVSILAEARDITDRKQMEDALKDSEDQFRRLAENSPDVIYRYRLKPTPCFEYVSPASINISGYTPAEYYADPLLAAKIVHPEDKDQYAKHFRNPALLETPLTLRWVHKDGHITWTEEFDVPVYDTRGKLLAYEGRVHDITEHRRLEEERQRVEKLESIGLLAGGIAHDFNNILTSILGNISLASMEAAPGSELRNSLEQAEKASLRAKDLTVQLLTFSKGGAPVTKLASLKVLLKDTVSFALRGSNVKCRFSIPADLWHAEIDEGQVSQVIHNLVINAQQAMPAGGNMELTAENMALGEKQSLGRGLPLTAGNYVRIAVTDHGSGIPAEQLARIFDPFFTTKQKGSGLGLATSFSIARQHGGHLSVESEAGSGSTFYLYLPASTEVISPKQAESVAGKAVGIARILVMDDEKGVREVAGRMLKHIGYEDVEFASHGAEAIKLYKAAMGSGNPFSVVILDLTIAGGMGGESAIKKLLKIDPAVKAIVSSGYVDDSVIARYREYGFSGMVAKPYTLEQLRKALQDVIGQV